MKMRTRQIPTRIHFPFGYVVKVKQVSDQDMRDMFHLTKRNKLPKA